jgi:hypothetical protein
MNISSLIISLFLLFVALLLIPAEVVIISVGILVLGLGISIVAILRREFRHYHAGRIDRGTMLRNSLLEITGTLLTLGFSIFLSRWAVARLIVQVRGLPGILLGMLAALSIGIVVSLLIRSSLGRLIKGQKRA